MERLRLLAPRGLRKPCRTVVRHAASASFSGSAPCMARQRLHGRLQQPRVGKHRPRHGHGLQPGPERTVSPPGEDRGALAGKHPPVLDLDRIVAVQEALKQVAGGKKCLLSYNFIRHGPSHPLTIRATKDETHQLAAARRFFEGGCNWLCSGGLNHKILPNSHVPEIVVLGASNTGKSSFINALVARSDAAKVGRRPGKTILINAYGVGPLPKVPPNLVPQGAAPPKHSLMLVDTPGYGYKSQSSWGEAIIRYLRERPMLRGAVLLLSSEKKVLPNDVWILKTLAGLNMRTLVVLTKADKARSQWPARCSDLAETLLDELRSLNGSVGGCWRAASGPASDIYVTAAGMDTVGNIGNGAGMGGVKAAILEMAGFTLDGKANQVTEAAESISYSGPVVSFDDIQWK